MPGRISAWSRRVSTDHVNIRCQVGAQYGGKGDVLCLVSSALASGAASSAIREDLREEEGGGAVEAGFFGGIFTSAGKVSCDDDGGADEWRKEDAGFSVSYRRSSFWGPRSGTRSLVTFARFPIASLICFDE